MIGFLGRSAANPVAAHRRLWNSLHRILSVGIHHRYSLQRSKPSLLPSPNKIVSKGFFTMVCLQLLLTFLQLKGGWASPACQ